MDETDTGRTEPEGPIERFDGAFGFLSNFYPSPVTLDGLAYLSVEHAFQAAKTDDATEREWIREAPTAGAAKRLGREVALKRGWDQRRVRVMRGLLVDKFTRHPELGERLLATGGRELIEGNHWSDRFWGVCDGSGENRLGHLLMEVRLYRAGRAAAGGQR